MKLLTSTSVATIALLLHTALLVVVTADTNTLSSLQLFSNEDHEGMGTATPSVDGRRRRKQDKEEKRRQAEQRRLIREEHRRQRTERQRSRQERLALRQKDSSGQPGDLANMGQFNSTSAAVEWILSNLTSLWETVRNLQDDRNQLLQQQGTAPHKILPTITNTSSSSSPCEGLEQDPEISPDACREEAGAPVCSGRGECICGQCACHDAETVGRYCECDNKSCYNPNGSDCSGNGACDCGMCRCKPGYVGDTCECSADAQQCTDPTGSICSNRGYCQCEKCICTNGYFGQYCVESMYSAGLCEQLKPCVLCKALGRSLPQCRMCSHVTVNPVPELESSYSMCRMVHSGCLLQYSYYKTSEDQFDVMVPQDMACPSN